MVSDFGKSTYLPYQKSDIIYECPLSDCRNRSETGTLIQQNPEGWTDVIVEIVHSGES